MTKFKRKKVKKCKNCGHLIYKEGKNFWLHFNPSNCSLVLKCDFCDCKKPEPDKSKKFKFKGSVRFVDPINDLGGI